MDELNAGLLACGETGFVEVSVVLFCPPTWYGEHWWTSHIYDDVATDGPLNDKPTATFLIPLDATLADALDRGAQLLGLDAGPDQLRRQEPVSSLNPRIGFVRAEDEIATDERASYDWPTSLPSAQPDGTITARRLSEVTYRELLVSAAVGLIEGDVTRPYLAPRMPQGMFGPDPDTARMLHEAIRDAYAFLPPITDALHDAVAACRAALPEVRRVTDDGIRATWWLTILGGVWKLTRRQRS